MTQAELTNLLDRASRIYYAGGESGISDTRFDLLLHELQQMEAESGTVLPNSPSLRVGSDLQEGFAKIRHPKPMLTIENSYDDSGLDTWLQKMTTRNPEASFYASVKYDGISCELHYSGGFLVSASTRGDKNEGDDITQNVRTIRSVPLSIEQGGEFYVRGEILLPKSRLESINRERVLKGEQPFSNTRNACSGSLKQLDPKVTASRGLIFRAWDCFGSSREFGTMEEKLETLQGLGFFFEHGTLHQAFKSNGGQEVNAFYAILKSMGLDYDFDGVVIKVNETAIQDEIGTKDTRAIEWGIARKWNEEYEASTTLTSVDWQVSRNGILTPVARVEPVECAGVTVSNITLNNLDFIDALDLHINDMLRITRSGGVIPYVLGAEHSIFSSEKVTPPASCPVCGAAVKRENVYIRCSNPGCQARTEGRLLYWTEKDCMDIKGIGDAIIRDLVAKDMAATPLELYTLQERYGNAAQIAQILGEGYGEAGVSKMLEAIEKSRLEKKLENIISSLGIPDVGKIIGRTLAAAFGSLQKLSEASEDELTGIDGIGSIMAAGICRFFESDYGKAAVEFLTERGFNVTAEIKEDAANLPLSGMTLCFSGSSSRFKGDAVEEYLESYGAKCTHSVGGKTTWLITGEKPGASKVKKATELGIGIISEDDFFDRFMKDL